MTAGPALRSGPERRIRVLLLVDRMDDCMGGGERTAHTIALGLPKDRYEVWVVTTRHGPTGSAADALREAGVHELDLARSSVLDLGALRRLHRLLRRERIDVVHAHLFGSNLWGTVLGRLAGVPVVVAHEHSWSYEGQPVRRVLDMAIGRMADAFVAVSRADVELMATVERVPRDKIHLIPSSWRRRAGNGIVDVRAQFGIPPGAPVVGTVATLRPVKRLDLLVEAFALLLADQPDAWLVIGGDGPARTQVEETADALGVRHRVVLTGRTEDVESLWRAIDVSAMASDREGTPVAALESMVHGVPMVAPAVGGIPDVLGDGGGVLVPRHDVPALARELLALVRDPERRAAIGARGRDRSADYTAERQLERCMALYDELLQAPAARRRAARRGAPVRRGAA